ncbi:MAG: ribosome-associated translation inhibitor RaiA [Bacilli bacterium]|nr:ribosome-associated translation inhibitor RaiA [Bacilli bacterium]
MNINIRGDKIEITEAIKNYVKEKLERLEKYFEEPTKISAHILIRVKNGEQSIEVTIPTDRYTLRAEEKHADLYAAVDEVIDVLERQIRKNKTKLNRYRNVENMGFMLFDDEVEESEEDTVIIKRKNISSKPMGEEEAILQMELLGHDFFVFKNIDEECTSVLYKRKDGQYGIINAK